MLRQFPCGYRTLLVLTICFQATFGLTLTLMPTQLYARGADFRDVAAALSAFALGGLFTRVGFGRFFNVLSISHMIKLANRLLAIATLGYVIAESGWSVGIARFVHGMAFALFATGASLWIAANCERRNRGTARGIQSAIVGISVAFLPAASLLIAGALGKGSVAALCLALAAAANVLRLPNSDPVMMRSEQPAPSLWAAFGALGLAGGVLGTMQAFLPLLLMRTDPTSSAGIFLTFGCAMIAGRLGGGMMLDRVAAPFVMRAGAALALAALIAPEVPQTQFTAIASSACYGLGVGALTTAAIAFIADQTIGTRTGGSTASVAGLVWELGIGGGPLLLVAVGSGDADAVWRVMGLSSTIVFSLACLTGRQDRTVEIE